jgi:hypothetical protein
VPARAASAPYCGIIESVSRTIALPDASGHLELVGADDGYISAVVCRRPDGSARWQALPPDGDGDAWVAVGLEGGTVVASSWSGWRVHYDLTTGTETARHFTK